MIGLPWWLSGKESACQCRRCGFDPWVGKILWKGKLKPIPVFLPGKFNGQRSLAGYSPWGRKIARHKLVTKQQQWQNIVYYNKQCWASLVAQLVRNLPAVQETQVLFQGLEDPLENEIATHSSILAWRIPWTEEPGGLQSTGLQESDTT